jgi:hypothetical protein
MTAGPADDTAAAAIGHGHLRASDADREQVIDTLKAAFVQGRLAKDELDARIGQTFASRTYAALAEITAGIPAGLTGAPPLRTPVRTLRTPARTRAKNAVAWAAYGILMPALFAVVIVPGYTTVVVAITTTAVIYFFFWLIGALIMIANSE